MHFWLILLSFFVPSLPFTYKRRIPMYRRQNLANKDFSPQPLYSTNDDVPSYVTSTVLRQVYPAMIKHLSVYGNPNIPLGSIDGKRCKTLRRLVFEEKLTPEEVSLLQGLNFRFNSLEEVYEEADFDECLGRLIKYEEENKTGYQIPKKYKPDPELGAWVTMIRRLGPDKIEADRRDKLNAIGFAWASTRKCGSSFMSNYRAIKSQLEQALVDGTDITTVLSDPDIKKWIQAQRRAAENGNLSEARCDYMDQLPVKWRDSF